ncbi:hypothetical protein Tco_1177415 [Tanacetum coccineum]
MANLDFCDKQNMVAYLQKSEGSERYHQIIDFLTTSYIRYALTKSPTIYISLIEQFWQTASARTLENGDIEITATIDGKVKVVYEASIRRRLKLEDSDGISTLPTSEIFEQLALMGSKKTAWEQFSSNIATAIICLATNRTFNFSKLIFDAMGKGSTIPVESHHTPISAPSTSQPPTLPPSMQTTHVAEEAATMPYDSPLPRVHSLRSDEGSMILNELTVICTTLSKKVETLESDLKQTKLTYGAAYTKLIMKVKMLEHKLKSSKARRRDRLVIFDDKDNQEDPFKQGRKIAQIDEDEGITLVQISAQTQRRHEHDFVEPDFEEDYTAKPDVSTANVPVSTVGAEVSTARLKVKTAAESLVNIKRSATKRKDKGKAIMKEAEPVQKKTKLQLEQERLGLKEALRLQEQLDEEERQRIARVHKESSTFNAKEWDNIQAQIEAVPKVVAGSSKRDVEQELNQESSKRQKIGEGSKPAEESKDELSQEQLQ